MGVRVRWYPLKNIKYESVQCFWGEQSLLTSFYTSHNIWFFPWDFFSVLTRNNNSIERKAAADVTGLIWTHSSGQLMWSRLEGFLSDVAEETKRKGKLQRWQLKFPHSSSSDTETRVSLDFSFLFRSPLVLITSSISDSDSSESCMVTVSISTSSCREDDKQHYKWKNLRSTFTDSKLELPHDTVQHDVGVLWVLAAVLLSDVCPVSVVGNDLDALYIHMLVCALTKQTSCSLSSPSCH